jgi:hypothetical protein
VHRKIKQLLGADMPADFKFVIARKSLQADIPKKETGDYEDFLCGAGKNALFPREPFLYFDTKTDRFTKTGSGQTSGKLTLKWGVSCRELGVLQPS